MEEEEKEKVRQEKTPRAKPARGAPEEKGD
jgi:hypothetical protein